MNRGSKFIQEDPCQLFYANQNPYQMFTEDAEVLKKYKHACVVVNEETKTVDFNCPLCFSPMEKYYGIGKVHKQPFCKVWCIICSDTYACTPLVSAIQGESEKTNSSSWFGFIFSNNLRSYLDASIKFRAKIRDCAVKTCGDLKEMIQESLELNNPSYLINFFPRSIAKRERTEDEETETVISPVLKVVKR